MATKKGTNYNPALGTSFKMEIPGFEVYNYFIQETEIPGLNMAGVDAPYRNNATNVPSNRIEYDPLNINLIIDEDFQNFLSIHLWMLEISFGKKPLSDLMRDLTLHILDSNKQPKIEIIYYSAYPISTGTTPLQSNVGDVVPVFCPMMFRYQYFDIKSVTNPEI